jgi:methylmalonyl-CoA/ethylmalonyl-CoA epimerase
MKPPVLELRVALTTGEFERLLKFYTDGLGLQPAALWDDAGQAVLLELGRGTLELFDEAHAAAVDEIEAGRRISGRVRFALRVPDLHAALERLTARGATVIHPPVMTPWGDYNVRVEDPDGLQVTLFQTPESS